MVMKRMRLMAALVILVVSVLGVAGCCKKAEEKIKSAESAIGEAKASQAGEYASNDLRSAEESLAQASALCKKGQCKKAEELAAMAESQARLAQQAAQDKIEADRSNQFLLNQGGSLNDDPLQRGSGPLQDVPFDFDSAELSSSAKSILSQNASYLQQNPNLRVKIEGHCDERGTDEYNLALGAKRAKSVYNYLLSLGVAASRMETISYGESLPKNPGNDESAWSSNRRAHFEGLQY